MKRLSIIAVLLLLASSVANSQIDSIPYNVNFPYYYMMHPIDSLYVSSHDGVQCQPAYRTIVTKIPYSLEQKKLALGFYPDSTIHIIGLAAVSWDGVRQGSVYNAFYTWFTTSGGRFKCKAYAPSGNTMQLLDSATVTVNDLNPETYRLYQFKMDYNGNLTYWSPYIGDGSQPAQHFILEAYFNNEITVSDSIYFSMDTNRYIDGLCAWYELHTPGSSSYAYPPLNYRIADTNATADDPWEQGVTYCYPLVFPIIRRDCDSCPQVRGVELFKGSSTQFFLRWESGVNHRDWQVSYGPAGTAPDDGTMLDFSQRQSSLITVDPDSHYVAYVRARCRFARDEWGPWSDPVDVHLNAPSNGIDAPGAAAATLTPNPASKYVTVTAQNPIALVEAYDERGALVDRQHGNGTDALRLDTRTWSAGTYILRIHTAKGIATHNLSIVR